MTFTQIATKMKHNKFILSFLLLLLVFSSSAYDAIGHRIIADIAYKNLNCKARHHVDKLLGKHGIIYAATWADEIKSDKSYDYSYQWHFQNLKDSMTVEELNFLIDNPLTEGEHLFYAIQQMMTRLKNNKNDAEALKFLVHFVGDLHQPMHLGRLEDLGGNKVKTMWFGKEINLHSLWDTYLIENKKYTYTEYSSYLIDKFKKQRKIYTKSSINESVNNSYTVKNRIYTYDMNDKSNYRYAYHFSDTIDELLFRGGMQLARILNEIF